MKLTLIERNPTGTNPQVLDLTVNYDESLTSILTKLNDYRAHDNQVIAIYNKYGQKVPLTYHVRGDITFYYEAGEVEEEKNEEKNEEK